MFLYAEGFEPFNKNSIMNKEEIRRYLIDNALNTIVKYVMEDKHYGMLSAMKEVYSSPIIKWLQDKDDELYTQSPAYIYELMLSIKA